jgi:mono/diheme cytochrome c family protein
MRAWKLKRNAGLAACALLAGCGGAGVEDAAPPSRTAGAVVVAPADDERIAQQLYLAYLGRAADPAGLAFFAGASRQAGLPLDMGAMYRRYGSEPAVRQVLDSLAGSPEAVALLSGDDTAAVTAMYRNLFNREPDPGGLAFWSGALGSGALTRAQVPVALLAGAAFADQAVFARKTALASAFTAALDTPERAAAYNGEGAAAALRQVLAKVTATTLDGDLIVLVDEALAAVAASPAFPKVQAIVRARCVACHSVTPTMRGFNTAPRGIRFDTPEQIRADAYRIYVNVVQTQFMPYGNQTNMTQAERAVVRAWYEGEVQGKTP